MSDDDANLFKQAVSGIKPLEQDKHVFQAPKPPRVKNALNDKDAYKCAEASFAFSDLYEAHFDETGPLRFCRENIPNYVLKQLRRGEYSPQWVLDCHGMTKQQMKQELVAMLHAAPANHIDCVNILHGVGGGILKQALPNYLVQHPLVSAFHQAPLEFGGHGALLVLLGEVTERQ